LTDNLGKIVLFAEQTQIENIISNIFLQRFMIVFFHNDPGLHRFYPQGFHQGPETNLVVMPASVMWWVAARLPECGDSELV